jgi:2-keto-4-pentenoate hydratase/2-oxohepta-3-ene-1,7-dioic acid hydratase in catechol pathway
MLQPPTKILGVGRNYAEHAAELGNEIPAQPLIFLKPASALIGEGGTIVLPPESGDVQYEGELVVIIGERCRRIPTNRVKDVIAGVACGNDITARDLQKSDTQWWRAKGFDTFACLGPVVTGVDTADLELTTRVNGEVRQQARTSEMIRGIDDLVSYVSEAVTLEPGDAIYTGTPAGVGSLHDGDVVEVEIESIGTLTNPVALERA